MTYSGAIIGRFCELLEDLCNKAELLSDDRDEAEWLPLSLPDLRKLVSEIVSIRTKKLLHLIPVDILVRLLKVLDHQIHRAEGLSIDECDNVSFLNSLLLVFATSYGADLVLSLFRYEHILFKDVHHINKTFSAFYIQLLSQCRF